MKSEDSNCKATLRRSDSESSAADDEESVGWDDPATEAADDEDEIAHVCAIRSMAKSADSTLSLVALFNNDSVRSE